MASTVSQADLKREKTWTAMVFVLLLVALLIVFQPIRRHTKKDFTEIALTYRFEKTIGPSERVKRELRSALTKGLAEDYPDARVTFPTTNEVRVRLSVEKAEEVQTADTKIAERLGKAAGDKFGKQTDKVIDKAGFADLPIARLGPLGLYRPKLNLRFGLDLQGGVMLVLRARTQNTQFEFRVSDSAEELKRLVEKGAPATAEPAKGEETKAAPPKAEAPKAEPAKDDKAKAAPTKAEAKTPAPAKGGETKDGKAPDGGQPIRLAQAPEGSERATKDGDAKAKEVEEAPPISADEAKLLSDDDLRQQVAEFVAAWAEGLRAKHAAKMGDIDVEVVGSNVVVLRTFIAPKSKSEREDLRRTQAAAFLSELQKVFPNTKALGEPQDLQIPENAIQQVKDVIARRVDKLGVAEAQVATQGTDRVAVQLPGIKDPDEAVQLLGTTARLEFRKVPDQYVPRTEPVGGKEVTTFMLKSGNQPVPTDVVYYSAPEFDGNKNIMVGSDLKPNQVRVDFDQQMAPAVHLTLQSRAASRFDKFARDNYQKYLAIYLDREVISAPQMQATNFGGNIMIHGGFENVDEANNLRILLNAGSLPVPVDIVEQRTVSATLGADAVRQSAIAGLVGMVLIVLMMGFMYRVPGILANVALVMYCFYTLAALSLVGATLTMPGILGLLLSVGMAVDANVIVFERLRDEVRHFENRPMGASIRHSYERAWPAILDGNVTCMMMAFVLYALGSGPIRGFAVTLVLGIVCHLFTALFVTRRFQNLLAATALGHERRAYRI
jgi:preprotein translocase subunit SecD